MCIRDSLWVRGGAILNDVFWRDGDAWRIDRDLLHGVDPFPTIFGFQREQDIVWAIRANGLLRIDLAAHPPTPPPPAPLLTSVFDTRARKALALNGLADLPPAVRDLRIDYALPVLRRGAATTYRSRLAGFEDWTDWTASGQQARIYTNLPDGEFQFEVEARDALQRESRMAPVALAIAPPWFRSAPAQTAYVGGSVLALHLALRVQVARGAGQIGRTSSQSGLTIQNNGSVLLVDGARQSSGMAPAAYQSRRTARASFICGSVSA